MPVSEKTRLPTKVSDLLAAGAEYEERDLPKGSQEPTHRLVPECIASHGHDAIEFGRYCGIELMPFQAQGLIDDLGYVHVTDDDGNVVERWAAQETEEIISRRNGKTVRFVALILYAMFVLGEGKILYTAHRDDTAKDVFDQFVKAIERTPRLWAEVIDKGPRLTNGQRSVELKTGQVVYFRTRGTDSGRGQGYDRLILDEDQNLTEDEMAALMPLVTGSENAQLNYAGSAGGRHSIVQAKIWRSYEAGERALCYRGWHSDPDADFDDLELVARTNPRLGRGLSYTFIAKERTRMSRPQFGRERCGAPTYPRAEGEGWVIPREAWERTEDPDSRIAKGSALVFAAEADPHLDKATISVAGYRRDGAVHIEVIKHEPGVLWVVAEAGRLTGEHGGVLALDPNGPLGYLLAPLRTAGVPVVTIDAMDLKDSATWIYTAANPSPDPSDPATVPPPGVYQRGGMTLTSALAAAETRKLLDRWTWRRSVATEVNQGPLTSATIAGYVLVKKSRQTPPPSPRKVSAKDNPRGYRTPPKTTRHRRAADLSKAGF